MLTTVRLLRNRYASMAVIVSITLDPSSIRFPGKAESLWRIILSESPKSKIISLSKRSMSLLKVRKENIRKSFCSWSDKKNNKSIVVNKKDWRNFGFVKSNNRLTGGPMDWQIRKHELLNLATSHRVFNFPLRVMTGTRFIGQFE